uniref:MYCBP associated protein n=1 Tax=Molossus molossus TaxID=27622 RepID=A0A7J8D042_MOLMO|nr:MYCBP associated protein [Molossus molossus]
MKALKKDSRLRIPSSRFLEAAESLKEKKRAKVPEQPTPPIQEEPEPVSNVLQGDDILALAIKKEDLEKVRMESRGPFLQELVFSSPCVLEPQPWPPSLLPLYSEGVSNSMEKSIGHKFFSLLQLKEFTICFNIPEIHIEPQRNEMMRCLAPHGGKSRHPHFTEGKMSLTNNVPALAGVAQGLECRPVHQRVAGLIPCQGLVPGLQVRSPGSVGAHLGGNQSMCLFHIDVSLSYSLLPFHSL